MINIGICDDEIGARTKLRLATESILDEDKFEINIFEFSSGEGLLNWLKKNNGLLTVLFLDIEMSGINGMETALKIRETNDELIIIFVTGYADCVFDGYKVNALDYLMKPVKTEKLVAVFHRALANLQVLSPAVFTFQNRDGFYRLSKKEIDYFYSDRRLVCLVSKQREYSFYDKLDNIEKSLEHEFVRIHNRYLVRAGAVDKIEDNKVYIGDATLPISRAHKSSALLALAKASISI